MSNLQEIKIRQLHSEMLYLKQSYSLPPCTRTQIVLHVKVFADFEIEFSAIKIHIYLQFGSAVKMVLLTDMKTLFCCSSFRNIAFPYIRETSIVKPTSSPTGFCSVNMQYKKTFCSRTFSIISIKWLQSECEQFFIGHYLPSYLFLKSTFHLYKPIFSKLLLL